MKTQHLGQHAETIATNYLLQKGYVILERNLHIHRYEIDIIAEIDQCLVVVEVKARSSKTYGTAREQLKIEQLKRIFSAFELWVQKKKIRTSKRSLRFN